jgi:hypothetical protein
VISNFSKQQVPDYCLFVRAQLLQLRLLWQMPPEYALRAMMVAALGARRA